VRGPLRLWITVSGLVVLHFLLHLGLGVGRAAPDLLTLALLIGARDMRMGTGAALGFAFGLLEDSFSLLTFGSNTIAMTLIGAAGARTRDLFVGDSALFTVAYFFAGKWAHDLALWLLMGSGLRESFVSAMLIQSTLAALYVAGVGLVVMWVTGTWWESSR
jgi:cell shape-determining protein MreD